MPSGLQLTLLPSSLLGVFESARGICKKFFIQISHLQYECSVFNTRFIARGSPAQVKPKLCGHPSGAVCTDLLLTCPRDLRVLFPVWLWTWCGSSDSITLCCISFVLILTSEKPLILSTEWESSENLQNGFPLSSCYFFLSLQLLTHIRSSTVAFAEAYPQHQKKSLLVFLCLTASSMYPIRRNALWVLLVGAYLKTEHFLWPEWIISSFKLSLKQETKCLESAKPPLLIAPKWGMFLVGRWTTGNSLNTEEVR